MPGEPGLLWAPNSLKTPQTSAVVARAAVQATKRMKILILRIFRRKNRLKIPKFKKKSKQNRITMKQMIH